ncbi:pyrimidine dimer DNA glycosylase/endonuclease V [Microbacterium sp. STN6]|uniref:pyrimidine dimer DNA glycosylase/endonuclease V n=1 Tax=Microbacterium sp. STN6 TaxID=2995588 RepID=UPI002260DF13|nr:pyrimidine dimer DNA glycosylase/endonuclease V [Microbacterium sp. STN6]MCX7522651.1 pyrimidine dimer DNA glycosylase/endonuclease V [Microbacterium sp. STN6]
MRLWSVHPRYLDRQGLTAAWREALLAQAVLAGRTRGYRAHPQLLRFREQADPMAAMAAFLHGVADEADSRGYSFDRSRIDGSRIDGETAQPSSPEAGVVPLIDVSDGQLDYEWARLQQKLDERSPEVAARWGAVSRPEAHPLFRLTPGPVAQWERVHR